MSQSERNPLVSSEGYDQTDANVCTMCALCNNTVVIVSTAAASFLHINVLERILLGGCKGRKSGESGEKVHCDKY